MSANGAGELLKIAIIGAGTTRLTAPCAAHGNNIRN